MIMEAAVLAGITAAGFYSIWSKLPKSVRDFMIKHDLATEAGMLALTYGFLGFTLLAHMAGGLIVLVTGCGLYIARNPDDFVYLFDARDAISAWMSEIQKRLNEYGTNYRNSKVDA